MKMSFTYLDKLTLSNLSAFIIILSIVAYVAIYKEMPPSEFMTLVQIAIVYLFTTSAVNIGYKAAILHANAEKKIS